MPRNNCIYKNGYFVKDLRIVRNRDVSNIVIVDNCITSFANHLDNGVPVPSFFGSKDDNTLPSLLKFLKEISKEDSIPECLIKRLKISALYDSFKKIKKQ